MMSQMSVVQPPDWTRNFHVFVNALDIAIDSVLMQLTEPKWYRPVYYANRTLVLQEFEFNIYH